MRASVSYILLMMLPGCSDVCANDIVQRVEAPDASLDAVVFERDCGATTGFSTQISVVRHGTTPKGPGNVFVADDDRGAAMAAPWGRPWADIKWLTPTHLIIRHDAKARIFYAEGEREGVRIGLVSKVRQ